MPIFHRLKDVDGKKFMGLDETGKTGEPCEYYWADGRHFVLIDKTMPCPYEHHQFDECISCKKILGYGFCISCECPDHRHFMADVGKLCIGRKEWYEEVDETKGIS